MSSCGTKPTRPSLSRLVDASLLILTVPEERPSAPRRDREVNRRQKDQVLCVLLCALLW